MQFMHFSIIYFFASVSLAAQSDSLQTAINQQVWIPFINSYQKLDVQGFMDVHTDDVVRISRSGNSIRLGDEYDQSQRASAMRNAERKAKRSIELRFLERIAREEVAFEVGYYKVLYQLPDKPTSTFYGKFHVLLKQIDGRWKIYMDSDINLPKDFSEEQFQAARALLMAE